MSKSYDSDHGYRFGDFVLDIDRGALLFNEDEVKLRPKSFEVLRYLAERSGKLVSRQEILDTVWSGAVVTDDAVTQCLMDIRRALRDTDQQLIKTVPRRGYLFEAQVVPLQKQSPSVTIMPSDLGRSKRWALVGIAVIALSLAVYMTDATSRFTDRFLASPQETNHPTIAVIPLVNMSSHEENVYFAGGIYEDVLTNLAQIERLQVLSRTSMLRFTNSEESLREISDELGVDYIVEGSVRRIGNHVRVTIQLIDAHNDLHLWANNYERELIDVFATQSELAQAISNSIHLELQPGSVGVLEGMPTSSVKAYDLFLRAETIEKSEGETEESMSLRREMLEEAVVEDPSFVEAWAVLKRVYDLQRSRTGPRGWFVADDQDIDAVREDLRLKAKRALNKAIALDPDNVETLLARVVDHDWPKTQAQMQAQKVIFDQIIAAHPEHAKTRYHLGWWYTHQGDFKGHDLEALESSAMAAFEQSLKLDPFNARMVEAVLTWYRHRGYQNHTERLAERFRQIVPETADDRYLARVSWAFKKKQIISAFLATADESLIKKYAMGLREAVGAAKYQVPISRFIDETELNILSANEAELSELANKSVNLKQSDYDYVVFTLLKSTGMRAFVDAGNQAEARLLAQRILEQEQTILAQWLNDCICYYHELAQAHDMIGPGALAQAHAVLGNARASQRLYKKLIDETRLNPLARIRVLAHMDIERAVDAAFDELAKNPSWNGFDKLAAYYVFNRQFLAHPKVQDYYRMQDKWIEYLAVRMPEQYGG